MSIRVTCSCEKSFRVDEKHAGKKTKCPNCGEVLLIPGVEESGFHWIAELAEEDLSSLNPAPVQDEVTGSRAAERDGTGDLATEVRALVRTLNDLIHNLHDASAVRSDGVREYKVLTQKDKWFSGKFDPERLEQAVNSYSGMGWRVRGITTATIPGFGGARDELIVLLER